MKRIYLKKVISLFYDYRGSVMIVFIYMLMLLGVSYCLPFFSKSLIDDGFIKGDRDYIIVSALCILGLNTVIIFINILKRKQALKMNLGVRAKLQRDVFRHLLKVKMSFFCDKNATSTFQCIDDDINNIASMFNDTTISGVAAVFSAIGGCIALFAIDWRLGLAVVLFAPINIIVSKLFAKKNNELITKTLTIRRKYSSWFGETISGIRVIRLFGLQKQKKKEMDEQINRLNSVSKDCGMILAYNTQIQELLTEILKALIYLLAAYFMLKSNLSVGSVVAFQAYMLMVSGSEATMIALIFAFFALFPHFKRYYDFFDEPIEKDTDVHIEFNDGNIEFRHVSFSYEVEGNLVFNDINLELPYGSKTAVVGDNGVGKTTFLNLLLAILEPVSGDVLVNGINIRDINPEEYRGLFSVVSQEVFLFYDTLKNNICLGKEVSQEVLDEIIRDVNLESFVEEYGFDYEITDNGSNLSGGQKQKIALARALIMERPILVFDEATANLDRMSIQRFIKLFDSRLKKTTVICVSHSEKIIDYFDNKLIIYDGSAILEHNGNSGIKKVV